MQRPEKGWDRPIRGVFRSIFDPKGIVATLGSRKSISTNSPVSHQILFSPQHPKMLALRLSFCISLLLLSPIIYATKVDIKDVIKLAREEVLLEAPCKDMYYLRDLVQKRMKRFYTAVYTFIIADPPGTVSKRGRSYLEDVEEMISCVDLPPKAPTSPTTRRFPIVLVENEPVQDLLHNFCGRSFDAKGILSGCIASMESRNLQAKENHGCVYNATITTTRISFDSLESFL